jgi:cell division protein FtsN
MYCSACDVEIKGADKDVCPMCGSPLAGRRDDVNVVNSKPQEPSALQEIIEDINTLIDTPEQPDIAAPDQSSVFMLRDYESALSTVVGVPGELPGSQQEIELSQEMEAEPVSDVSLHDMLDSIRQSIATPEDIDEEYEDGPVASDSGDGIFTGAVTAGPDVVVLENRIDDDGDFMPAFENDVIEMTAVKMDSPEMPVKRRRPVIFAVLMFVLIAGGGYYAFTELFDSPGRDAQVRTLRSETPLAALNKDRKTAPPVVEPLTETAAPGVRADADVGQHMVARADTRLAVSGSETAETVVQPVHAAASQPAAAGGSELVSPPVSESVIAEPVIQPVPVAKPLPRPATVKAPFYTVHAGSYTRKETADSEAARIRAAGYDAFVEQADLGSRGIWYRVKAGRFKTKAEAVALQTKIHKVLVPDSLVVLNRSQ